MCNLLPIEFKQERILTTEQLAIVYKTEVKNIQMNFSNNQKHFELGKHYFYLEGEELRAFKNSLPNDIGEALKFAPRLYLWTERGANRHCKILDTDKAWEQFDNLEETYFRVKENHIDLSNFQIPTTLSEALRLAADLHEKNELLENEKQILLPKAQSYDQLINSKGLFSMGEVAQSIGLYGRTKFMNMLRNMEILQSTTRRPYQPFVDSGYFKVKDIVLPNGESTTVTKVTPRGVDYIVKRLKKAGLLPSPNTEVSV